MQTKVIARDPQKTIKSAVDKYVSFIAPTYGPAGKTVLIDTGAIKAIDDGHTVSKDFELEDELENAVAKYIKQASEKTNSRVGDGTTTSGLIMGAIIDQVYGDADDVFHVKPSTEAAIREIRAALPGVIEAITKSAKKIKGRDDLYAIALNSFNNEEIAGLIADTLHKIGPDGVISIADSQTASTEIERVDGLELQKGYFSPYLINTDKEEVVLKDASVVVVGQKLESFVEIAGIVKPLVEQGIKNIAIFAEGFGDDAITGTVVYKMRGVFNPLLVEAPSYGEQKKENLRDIAIVSGATYLDAKLHDLKNPVNEWFGFAGMVQAKSDKTTLTKGKADKVLLAKHIEALKTKAEGASSFETERAKSRIAAITGGVAVIKVGALTEHELGARKAKVEDAVNATKAAFKNGIVKGAGETLLSLNTSSSILNEAFKAPRKQLEDNGKEFLDEKVYDPAEVLIAAVESAVSVAIGLLSIGNITALKREKKNEFGIE